MPEPTEKEAIKADVATRLRLGGHVQGVGFRPFVYRLAQEYCLTGWVQNLCGEVLIHLQGPHSDVDDFITALFKQAPQIAKPVLIEQQTFAVTDIDSFTIRNSEAQSHPQVHTPVDYAPCEECLKDIADPHDRRYQYPFTNCTQCGPRYTLIERLPYDRSNTTMDAFPLCEQCRLEYLNPDDRRFHAEPVACPVCGPSLTWQHNTDIISGNAPALQGAINCLKNGQIVAIKGVGGYHLFCDAHHEQAIIHLRTAKPRPDKPLAIMFPANGHDELDTVRRYVTLTQQEASLLRSSARPIVLVKKMPDCSLPETIAPGLGELGCCLPYSPLHYLLLQSFNAPLVATSANISGEPVLTREREVIERLSEVTTTFLHHDRPISRPADDSVVRVIAGRPRTLRVGRGYAPIEMTLPDSIDKPTLAVGGHMKNSIALAWENRLVISPHIADLGTLRSMTIFEQVINDFQRLYKIKAAQIACDAHPGYTSSRWAHKQDLPVIPVLHHHAHASALAVEFPQHKPWLIFTWDGSGYGEPKQIWGGEAFYGSPGDWQRVASFKPFRLPGGDLAARQAWRSAAALCWQSGMDYRVPHEHSLIKQAWEQEVNCTNSSAVGRLFDAAAALTGLATDYSFEGQGPMLLEAHSHECNAAFALPITCSNELYIADWQPLLKTLLDDQLSIAERASYFHTTLASTLVEQARLIRQKYGEFNVGLGGGVFQNKCLTELIIKSLRDKHFHCHMGETIPCNDGGLGAGQIMEVLAKQSLT